MKFSGQGTVLVAKRDTSGNPLSFYTLGCADELDVKLNIDKWEHTESCTGQRGVDAQGFKKASGEISLAITDWNQKNLELALNGTTNATATGSAVNETLHTGIVVGDIARLLHMAPTSVVITDSAGSPATVSAGHYEVDTVLGTVKFLNVTGYTQPFQVSYSWTDPAYVAMLSAGLYDMFLRFEYINTQNANQRGLVEFYKVQFNPTESFELLNEELQVMKLTGSILMDTTKSAAGALGQYGRCTLPPA